MAKKNEGKIFESDWSDSYKKTNHFYMRLRDSAKWVQETRSSFTPENPCDSIQFSSPFLYMLELKSCGDASITFTPFEGEVKTPWSKPKNVDDRDIKTNQIRELMGFSKHQNIIPGFIFNFRERALKTKSEPNEAFFVHVTDLISFAKSSGKSSINREECRAIGVQINAKKKISHYTYDIDSFVDDSVNKCLKDGHLNMEVLMRVMKWIESLEGVKSGKQTAVL